MSTWQAMAQLGAEIARALELGRFVVLQGPVGSGKSTAVSQALSLHHEVYLVRIVPQAEDRGIDYAVLEGTLDDPENPHASMLRAGSGPTVPLWVIDDFHLLDEASAALIGWAVESGILRLLASTTHPDASPELTRLLDTMVAHRFATAPLDVPAVRTVLTEYWERPVVEWEAVLAARFTAGNLAALGALAGFVTENFPSGATPDTWVEHLYSPDIASYGPLINHVREIRESLEDEVWVGLQRVAIAGRLSPTQANQLLGRSVIERLSESGLIMLEPKNNETRAASGLLDLGIRMHLSRDELSEFWDAGLGEVLLAPGQRPLPSHLAWWRANGIALTEDQLLAGARHSLNQGLPAPALALLRGVDPQRARWMRAEAGVLDGHGPEAAALVTAALADPGSTTALGSNEALVAVGSGLWPGAAAHFTDVGGLPELASLVYSTVTGDHAAVLALAELPRVGYDPQIGACLQVLQAATLAVLGSAAQGRALLEELAPAEVSWSGITTQNINDARGAIYLLHGDWDRLERATTEGSTLHWAAERAGLGLDLRTLRGLSSASLPRALDAAVHAPLGYHLLRLLARAVADEATDVHGALRRVRILLSDASARLPGGVELLGSGWELRLVLASGAVPSEELLRRIIELSARCEGRLSHFLLLAATGLRSRDASRLRAAAEFAERQGMGAWLKLPLSADVELGLLSRREREIADRVIAGETAREIAVDLELSIRTVEKHLANTYRKLGISGRVELTRFYDASEPRP